MLTCSKTYRDIPFAHRQWRHPGHCSRIHGHNWAVKLTFACSEHDENGFVLDFGSLAYIKEWIDDHLDHACVLGRDDPLLDEIQELADKGLFRLHLIENASCEGVASHLMEIFDKMIRENTDGRAWIKEIELQEDSRNIVNHIP